MKSDDCASGLHDYCVPCDCSCHKVAPSERVSEGKEPVPHTTPCTVAWLHTPLQFDWQCAVCGKFIAAARPAVEPREEPDA
jgi:hypothetical protein